LEFAERLFEQIKGFGDYGFPESHAASFALLVYVSLWLKAHYPAQFACALINSQPMGFYSPRVLVRDAQKHGVVVHPVQVSHSHWDCAMENGALRLGFRLLKGFSEASAARIVTARQEAPFSSVDDFVCRTHLPKLHFQALAEAGALVELEAARRQALWQLEAPRVAGLFLGQSPEEPRVTLPPLQELQTLLLDYRHTGLSLDDHPLCHLRPQLSRRGVLVAKDLPHCRPGERVKIAGLVQARQRPATASGVVFITLEDETGVANLILFAHIFEQQRQIAQHAMLLLAVGKVEPQLTRAQQGQVGAETPVIHVIVEKLERLELKQGSIPFASRDFH
jgi:error-prone DNA polymerase